MATNKRPNGGPIDNRDIKRQNTGPASSFKPENPITYVRTNYWPVEMLTNKIFKYHFEFVDERIIEEPSQLRKIIRCTFDFMKMPRGTSRFVWGNSLFTLNALPTEFIKIPIEIAEDARNNIPACSIVISGPDAFDFESTVKGMQRASRHAGNQEYEMVQRKEGSFVCQIINILFKPILKGMGLTSMGRQGYFNVGAGEGNDRNVSFMPGFNPVVSLHGSRLFLHTDFQYRAIARDNALRHVYNTDPKKMQGQSVFCEHNKRHYIVSSVRRDMTPNSTFDLKDGTKKSYADYYQSRYGLRVRDFKQPMLEVTQRSKEGVKSIYLVPEFCKIAGIPREELKNTRLPTTSTVERHQKLSRFISDFMASATRNKFSTVKVNQQFYDPGALLLRPQMIKFYGTKQHRLPSDRFTWDELLRSDSSNKMLEVQKFPWTIWVTDRSLEADARSFYDTFVKVMHPLCQNGLETPNWIIDDYRNVSSLSKATLKPVVVVVVLGTVDATMYNSVKRDLMAAGIPSQVIVREKFMKGRYADMSKVTKAGLQILTKAGGVLWTTTFEPNDPLGHKLAALHTCVFGIERSIGRSTGATTKIAVTCTVDRDPSRFSEYFNYHAGEAANSMPSLQSIVERGLTTFKNKNQKLPGRLVFYSSGASEGSLKAVLANDVKEVKSAIAELYKGQPQPEMLYVLVCRGGTTRLFAEEKGYVSNVKPGTLVDKNICTANEFFLVSHDAGQKSVLAPKYILAHHDEPDDKQKVAFTMRDLQRLSFGLCHLYYNWPGPISCPAPLKYADKLAKLAAAAMLPSRTDNALATKLFYI